MTARTSRLGVDPLDSLDTDNGTTSTATAPRSSSPRKPAKTEPAPRIMVNTRLDPQLVAEAKKVARLSGDSLTALIAEGMRREIARRRKGLAATLRAEIEALEAQ